MRFHLERAFRRPFYGRASPLFMIHERVTRGSRICTATDEASDSLEMAMAFPYRVELQI